MRLQINVGPIALWRPAAAKYTRCSAARRGGISVHLMSSFMIEAYYIAVTVYSCTLKFSDCTDYIRHTYSNIALSWTIYKLWYVLLIENFTKEFFPKTDIRNRHVHQKLLFFPCLKPEMVFCFKNVHCRKKIENPNINAFVITYKL